MSDQGVISDPLFTSPDGSPVSAPVSALVSAEIAAPDLRLAGLSFLDDWAVAGGPFDLDVTVENIGDADATVEHALNLYLSADGTFDAGDTLIGSVLLGPLAAGADLTASLSLAIDAAMALGSYTLFAEVDAGGAVAESNEANNLFTGGAVEIVGMPDLVARNLTTSSSLAVPLAPGSEILVSGEIANIGADPVPAGVSGPHESGFWLSDDLTFTTSDVLLAYQSHGATAPGGSETITDVLLEIPMLAPGTYYIALLADDLNYFAETDESNNVSNVLTIEVDATPPDLTLSGGLLVSDGLVNLNDPTDELFVDYTIGNDSFTAVDGEFVSVGYYLSYDDVIDPFDLLIGFDDFGFFLPGQAADSYLGLDVSLYDLDLLPGAYHFGAIVDPFGAVFTEETVDNNSLYFGEVYLDGQPELSTPVVTLPDAPFGDISVLEGGTVDVSVVNANTGPYGTLLDVATRFYLSTDSVIDAGDIFIGDVNQGPLDAYSGPVDSGPITLSLSGVAPGTYWLGAIADPLDAIPEWDETDNASVTPLLVTVLPDVPDLTIPAFDLAVKANPHVGDPELLVDFSLEIRNDGYGTAAASTAGLYLSFDDVLDAGDLLLSPDVVPELAAGESFTFSVTDAPAPDFLVPAETPAWLFLVADDGDVLGELSEVNNIASVSYTLPGSPDLSVSDLRLSSSHLAAGEAFDIQVTVTNAGPTASGTEDLALVFGDTGVPGAWNGSFATLSVGPLAAGESVTLTHHFAELPAGFPAGADLVGAVIDADGGTWEADETNNETTAAIQVSAPAAGTGAHDIAQLGSALLSDAPLTVQLDRSFTNPVVFALLHSAEDATYTTVRITDVQSDSFTMKLQNPVAPGAPATPHGYEEVSFLVIEEGVWEFADGVVLQAGLTSAVGTQGAPTSFGFEGFAFDAAPTLVTQVQSDNGPDFAVTRTQNVTADGAEVWLQEVEADGYHGAEDVGFLAIADGSASWDGRAIEAGALQTDHLSALESFASAFTGAPALFASVTGVNGIDPTWAGVDGLTASGFTGKLQEDQTVDDELYHGVEDLDWFAVDGPGGILTADVARPWMAEYGTFQAGNALVTVSLEHAFENPVVFAMMPSFNGPVAATTRITNVSSDSFTAFVQETSEGDRYHGLEDISYLVVEAGTYQLEDGRILEVGTLYTKLLSSAGFAAQGFDAAFTEAPEVFTQVQSFRGPDWVTTRLRNIDAAGFEVAMQEDEANNSGSHTSETIGYMAIEGGVGSWNGNALQVADTGEVVDESFDMFDFAAGLFTAAPTVIGGLNSFVGADPASLRYDGVTAAGVSIAAIEDQSADGELAHIAESASIFALAGDGGRLWAEELIV
ncbi:CARDB domain-containing protein [Rhodovulum sp. DZ06]|uniref:CARDB domain-containing protein n=1 Tax=Rhodovulum sp. DZ06 TaxID=3425126 RepID=UPI003D33F97C